MLETPPWWIKTLIVIAIVLALFWAGMKTESAEHYPTQEKVYVNSR